MSLVEKFLVLAQAVNIVVNIYTGYRACQVWKHLKKNILAA